MGFETSTYSVGAPGGDDPVFFHKEQEARNSEKTASITYRNLKQISLE
jgi:hypothetical protein